MFKRVPHTFDFSARPDTFPGFVRALINRKEMRVETSQPGSKPFRAKPATLALSGAVNSGRGSGGRRRWGRSRGRWDKCKGTNIQLEREIILRTNRERRQGKERKGYLS